MEQIISRTSFSKVWENMGKITTRRIIHDYMAITGLSAAMFYYQKNGLRAITSEVADQLELVFDKYGYSEIWDK